MDKERAASFLAHSNPSSQAWQAIELRDRSHLEQFIDADTGQPMRFSFGWDDWAESVAGDASWIIASGHEIAHAPDCDRQYPFPMTLVCRRSGAGWRIAHLHAPTPSA